jgi:hypothetical protein
MMSKVMTAVAGSAIAGLLVTGSFALPAMAGTGPVAGPAARVPASAQARTGAGAAGASAAKSVRTTGLYGVACTSRVWCMTVGFRAGGNVGRSRPLAERWDGRGWRVLPVPGAPGTQLVGVSCRGARDCVAVGYRDSYASHGFAVLAEQWNGARWLVIQSRNPGHAASAFLNGVSCTRRAGCVAVGSTTTRSGDTHALAEKWTRGHWRTLSVTSPALGHATDLNGVSCAGVTCMAVGQYTRTGGRVLALSARWNGRAWRVLRAASAPGASYNLLQDVSCRTASACRAVGYAGGNSQHQLTEIWQGRNWRLTAGRNLAGAQLDGLSCPARTGCVAVGAVGSKPLSQSWTGSTWRVMRTARPRHPAGAALNQVSCQDRTCVSVGYRYQPGQLTGQSTLAERWNGRRWQILETPNP